MRRSALLVLDDILDAIGNIEEDTSGITERFCFSLTGDAGMPLSGILR
ncbi:hypothetical protein ASZ90_014612 [hydrocarbon metagenome]|uniref:Uncharacterized protein n=1 Tax=hydrocarbon metagenome TaxID=938273 RepID=A0A0W8F4J2_9ZZZZ